MHYMWTYVQYVLFKHIWWNTYTDTHAFQTHCFNSESLHSLLISAPWTLLLLLLLNQARAGKRLTRAWFFKKCFCPRRRYVCVCVCVCVSPPPRLWVSLYAEILRLLNSRYVIWLRRLEVIMLHNLSISRAITMFNLSRKAIYDGAYIHAYIH